MAEIRCPNCGKNNPDILDICQFCQTPLQPDSVLRIGQTPTKKNTGELESVLPEWLRDVRQQARDSAEEEAAQTEAQKDEPPDLLAGLASEAGSADEDEIPDWLASINPTAKQKPAPASAPTPAPETDFFAQFNQSEAQPPSEPPQEEMPAWTAKAADDQPPIPGGKDELSEWFSQASKQPEDFIEFDSDAQQGGSGWANNFEAPSSPQQEPAPKEEEDLSWLHNLEESAKQTGDLKTPRQDMDWTADFELPSTPSQPSAAQEDLSWLNSLGGVEEPAQQSPGQPSALPDDSSWLNNLGAVPESSQPSSAFTPGGGTAADQEQPTSAQPSEEDLSWLTNLGGASEAPQPFSTPVPDAGVDSGKPFSQDDLSWLNDLGKPSEPSQPSAAAQGVPSSSPEDLDWLKGLGGESEQLSAPPFVDTGSLKPRQTAPLGEKAQEDTEPDWLKSAAEAPSMPAPGDVSMDWFTGKDQSSEPVSPAETAPVSPTSQPSALSDLFATPGEPSALSNQDVDSLFSAEMPDWLLRPESAAQEAASPQTAPPPAEGEESLAPVNLPSWVQAMRPVEAVISETAAGAEEQPEETEGPLAGLRGVIPGAPIGSSMRPKAVSLKLQATDEQQASAALLEQILGSETNPRALVTSSFVMSQQWLRLVLTGLFLILLGTVIGLRSQAMPIPSVALPEDMQPAATIVGNVPENGRVLVIVDYEPALAGEMEAVGGPVLSHVVLRRPILAFVSTSPTGPGLVERLMTDTRINQPSSDPLGGFGYAAGEQYFNLGYLPGGSAGVLGFVEGPGKVIPATGIQSLSEYAAIILMTDHVESGRVWVEQLYVQKQKDPRLTNQPLLVIASAQADPMLQPYVSSRQINGIVSGLSDGARYEAVNVISVSPKTARSYWDAFGIGVAMSIALIVIGSLWSVFTGIRARRAEAEQG